MNVEEELKTYLQVLRRYKWMIAACAIIASLVALGISFALIPIYTVTTTVRVASSPGGSTDYIYGSSITRLSNTYVEIATSDVSLEKVVERLGLEKKPSIEVEVVPETELIEITASDPDPVRARDIANTLASILVEQSLQLYGGNAPTAREILQGQLEQSKIDLDNAVLEYDKALRTALVTPTPLTSTNPTSIPDLDVLERFVSIRQQIYNNLLQEYQRAETSEQMRIFEAQIEQAKIDLDRSISDYNNALRNYKPTATPLPSGTLMPNPDVEKLERIVSVRQQIYSDLLQKYENARTSELLRTNSITVVQAANLPRKPSSPKILLNAALGLVAGLVVGVILAFFFEGIDNTLRSTEEVLSMTTLPILCRIPELKNRLGPKIKLINFQDGHYTSVPAIDQLRMHLLLHDGKSGHGTFLLTSPDPGAGKSTIVANLAVALSQVEKTVVLVDIDFRRPRQHSIFELPNEMGLSDYIQGKVHLDEILNSTANRNLRVITTGSSPQGIVEWITPEHICEFLETLGSLCDYVLVDAPALLSVADPMILAAQTDAVILVVAQRKTDRENFRFALNQLSEFKARVLGVVVNFVPNSQIYKYYSQNDSLKGFVPLRKK
jgi:capsular exopolysaccharide synthesis family protein